MIKTVLGEVNEREIKTVLCHEHVCCYLEYLNMMSGELYIDKKELVREAATELRQLREKYDMNLFVDCTAINIGRDLDLLKEVSETSEVHIVGSTGFYYTEEPVINQMSYELLAKHYIIDAKRNNLGIIKAAVERSDISHFDEKLLRATAIAQLELGLPIALHTNANNKNGLRALQILLGQGVKPEAITVGHMSDAEDMDYLLEIAGFGCYIGLDRLYDKKSEEVTASQLKKIKVLCDLGFEDKILLSHDESIFNGFGAVPAIKEERRFRYQFEKILPMLDEKTVSKLVRGNPIRMLNCEK